MSAILEIQNIGKRYSINHLGVGYLSLREQILSSFKKDKSKKEDFWALRNISFEVQPGESIGIIGRNGAGKSTLLKILSKITPPTTGRIISRGRIASLLEVGTGFHPELTGRENIFFNGSLLGMKRKEIEVKFDEIVNFSGVERFLDTQLKHYSSGMQLRLAFAVAAFLEPEILIIDEVLAVGDAEFQKKCLGKMEDVSKSGRTILFVSHNMQAVANLCKKAIYLVDGEVDTIDTVNKTVDCYINHEKAIHSKKELIAELASAKPDKDFKLDNITITQDAREVYSNIVNGRELEIKIEYELFNQLVGFRIFLDVCDQFGTTIFRSFHDETSNSNSTFDVGRYTSHVILPSNLLAPLPYDFKIRFGVHNVRMIEPETGFIFRLNVEHSGLYNNAYHGQYSAGLICPVFPWKIQRN